MRYAPTDDVPELTQKYTDTLVRSRKRQDSLDRMKLYDADPNCKHHVIALWSGVKCTKCRGWFCL